MAFSERLNLLVLARGHLLLLCSELEVRDKSRMLFKSSLDKTTKHRK